MKVRVIDYQRNIAMTTTARKQDGGLGDSERPAQEENTTTTDETKYNELELK